MERVSPQNHKEKWQSSWKMVPIILAELQNALIHGNIDLFTFAWCVRSMV